MSLQLFKNIIPKKNIFDLLEYICVKKDKNFILNKDAFKKGIFDNKIPTFVEECKEYYLHQITVCIQDVNHSNYFWCY